MLPYAGYCTSTNLHSCFLVSNRNNDNIYEEDGRAPPLSISQRIKGLDGDAFVSFVQELLNKINSLKIDITSKGGIDQLQVTRERLLNAREKEAIVQKVLSILLSVKCSPRLKQIRLLNTSINDTKVCFDTMDSVYGGLISSSIESAVRRKKFIVLGEQSLAKVIMGACGYAVHSKMPKQIAKFLYIAKKLPYFALERIDLKLFEKILHEAKNDDSISLVSLTVPISLWDKTKQD